MRLLQQVLIVYTLRKEVTIVRNNWYTFSKEVTTVSTNSKYLQ